MKRNILWIITGVVLCSLGCTVAFIGILTGDQGLIHGGIFIVLTSINSIFAFYTGFKGLIREIIKYLMFISNKLCEQLCYFIVIYVAFLGIMYPIESVFKKTLPIVHEYISYFTLLVCPILAYLMSYWIVKKTYKYPGGLWKQELELEIIKTSRLVEVNVIVINKLLNIFYHSIGFFLVSIITGIVIKVDFDFLKHLGFMLVIFLLSFLIYGVLFQLISSKNTV